MSLHYSCCTHTQSYIIILLLLLLLLHVVHPCLGTNVHISYHIIRQQSTSPTKTFGKYEMKGLITTFNMCNYCNKRGHEERNCWEKHPEKRPKGIRTKSKTKCHKCGKIVHWKRDCKPKEKNHISATLSMNKNKNTNCIDRYSKTYVDSASSCHTVNSLKLLDRGSIQQINESVKSVDGTEIKLTHKGKRTIRTKQGTITLGEV